MDHNALAFRTTRPISSTAELTDETTALLGDHDAIIAVLSAAEPRIRWSRTPWITEGTLDLGEAGALMFRVHLGAEARRSLPVLCTQGDDGLGALDTLCRSLGWTAVYLRDLTLVGANVVPPPTD